MTSRYVNQFTVNKSKPDLTNNKNKNMKNILLDNSKDNTIEEETFSLSQNQIMKSQIDDKYNFEDIRNYTTNQLNTNTSQSFKCKKFKNMKEDITPKYDSTKL